MLIKDLIKQLQELNPNGEVCIVDNDQDNCYEILEVRTCEDRTSEDFRAYADIAINLS